MRSIQIYGLLPILLITGYAVKIGSCVNKNVQITSPSIQSFITSPIERYATAECMAACQASDVCEYWTSLRSVCYLKQTNSR